MYIEKIHIDTFGKLSDFDLQLTPGVNIIEGANESGKSTIAAFIRFILYGASAKERAELLSWRTGGAAGSVTINTGKRRYRVERAVVGSREVAQLIDPETNIPIRNAIEDKTPGELLFGVDADMFSATAFVAQLGDTAVGGKKVSEGIENILFSADEGVNTQKALSKLDAARAALLHKNEKGGRLYELDQECAQLEVRLAAALEAHRDILAKEAQLEDTRANLAAAKEKADTVGSRVEQFEARTILGLFKRMHALDKRVQELRAAIEQTGAPDPDYVRELDDMIDRIKLLRREIDEVPVGEPSKPAEVDPKLAEYTERGGREALEAECEAARATSKTYTAVGIVALVMGVVAALAGLLPLMGGGSPQLWLIVGGVIFAAVAVTLFVMSARARGRADAIEAEYDFEALEAAEAESQSAAESLRFAELAANEARRRYDEACEEARQIYGVEPEELETKLAELNESLRAIEGARAEYDKHATLLANMREQLDSYSEDELRAKVDMSIDISDIDAVNLPAMRRESDMAEKMAASLEKCAVELEKTLAGLYPTAEDPTKLSDRLGALKLERSTLAKKHAAYKLACEKLAEASESLRESVAPRLASDAAQLMAGITDGKYSELGVGADLEMTAQTEAGLHSLHSLSAGTQDAAYLSLRMALISLLYRKTLPPVIYDESFSRQDDERLRNFLKLIGSQEMQSLIFTSNDRDAALMRTLGEFNSIHM